MRVDVYVTKTFGLWVTSTLHVVATRWLKDDLLEVGSHDGWIELSTLHVVQRKVMESWNGRGCVPSLGKTMKTNDYTSLHRSLDRVERVTCMIGKGECIRYVGVFSVWIAYSPTSTEYIYTMKTYVALVNLHRSNLEVTACMGKMAETNHRTSGCEIPWGGLYITCNRY